MQLINDGWMDIMKAKPELRSNNSCHTFFQYQGLGNGQDDNMENIE